MNRLPKIIDKIESALLLSLLFLYPLFVTTLFPNLFDTSKLLLISFGLGLVTLIKVVKLFLKDSFELSIGKYDIFMLLLALIFLFSGIFAAYNKVEAFFLPGNASFVIFAVLIYFYINQKSEDFKSNALIVLTASVFILSIYQILNFVGIISHIPFLPEAVRLKSFNPMGNILSLIVILIAILPYLLDKILNRSDLAEKILSSLVALAIISGTIVSALMAIPGKDTSVTILNLKHGFPIAIDSLKENPIFGVGPSYFSYAFNKFRPLDFNTTDIWDIKFLQNSSQFLTIFTEVGILSVLIFVYLGYLLYKTRDFKNPLFISLIILLLGVLTLPISFSSLPLVFVLFALQTTSKTYKMGYFVKKIPQVLIAVPVVTVVFLVFYFFGRGFYAENVFLQGVKKLNSGDAVLAYELINKSVALNPYSDRFHQFAANLNIVIAQNMAQNQNLTDEDKRNISNLIQQAVREGKAAVSVNPKKAANWESLSEIYRSIMSFAKGADTFAVESLRQAISLDPINPILRIKLGSLYYSLGKYEEAVDVLKLAVLAKSDHPNARYNLALAYKENKQIDRAKEQIKIVLELLGKESKDYEVALKELQNLESLTEPSPIPEPAEPQVELPTNEEALTN